MPRRCPPAAPGRRISVTISSGCQHRFEIAGEKLVHRDFALAALRARDDLRIERDEGGRRIEVGIGMRHRAAERRHGSHPHGRDVMAGLGEERGVAPDGRGGLERLERGERADPEAAILRDAGERLEGAKTDHEAGPHEALLHQIDEAGAARDELRLAAMPRQQRQRLIEARRFEIGEGDHVIPPRPRLRSIR